MEASQTPAAGYFKVTQPLPRVFRMEDPRGVFLTLLVGNERAFLADTGMGVGDAAQAVRELTGKPVITANTHGHIDHTGGNYQFGQVWLSPEEMPILRDGLAHERRQPILDMEDAPMPLEFDPVGFLGYSGDNLLELRAGQRFDLGGLAVEAVPLPTHTRGSMGFFCPELELLLTGDSLSTFVYLVFPESCTVSQYLEELDRIESIPFTRMLSAHEAQIMGREHFGAFRRCAQALQPEKSVRFRNPLFPDRPGRMFIYEASCCSKGYAALVYTKDKLGKD